MFPTTRAAAAAACFLIVLGACGSPVLTLSEYATQVEALVAEMEARFGVANAAWEAQDPSLDGARSYWDERLDIREDFLDGVEELRPPDPIEALHDEAVALFTRITEADKALADRVTSAETVTDHWGWVETAEGQAAEAVLADVYDFCRRSQERFDATRDRDALQDTPWIPPEMKEVVAVAFGCPP